MGCFSEGVWLYKNNWDFLKLMFEEPSYDAGGARTYLISIYPSFIAFLYKIFSGNSKSVFFVLHVYNLLIGILCLTYFNKILSKIFESISIRFFILMLLGTSPLFLSQVASLGQDLSICFFTILSLYFYLDKRKTPTFIAIMSGFLVKGSIFMFGASLAIYEFMQVLRFKDLKRLKWSFAFSLPFIIYYIFSIIAQKYFYLPGTTFYLRYDLLINPLEFVKNFIGFRKNALPEILLVINVLSLLTCLFSVFSKNVRQKICSTDKQDLLLFLFFGLLVFQTLVTLASIPVPRYFIWFLPHSILLFTVLLVRNNKHIASYVFIALILLATVNTKGYISNSFWQRRYTNAGHILETTLLKQDLISRDLELISNLEKDFSNKVFVTERAYFSMITEPLFGYVKQPLKAIFLKQGGSVNLYKDKPRDRIWLEPNNHYMPRAAFTTKDWQKACYSYVSDAHEVRINFPKDMYLENREKIRGFLRCD